MAYTVTRAAAATADNCPRSDPGCRAASAAPSETQTTVLGASMPFSCCSSVRNTRLTSSTRRRYVIAMSCADPRDFWRARSRPGGCPSLVGLPSVPCGGHSRAIARSSANVVPALDVEGFLDAHGVRAHRRWCPRPATFSSAAATRARSPVNSTPTPYRKRDDADLIAGAQSVHEFCRGLRGIASTPRRDALEIEREQDEATTDGILVRAVVQRASPAPVCPQPRQRLCEMNSADNTRRGAPSIVSVKSSAVSPATGPPSLSSTAASIAMRSVPARNTGFWSPELARAVGAVPAARCARIAAPPVRTAAEAEQRGDGKASPRSWSGYRRFPPGAR